MSSSYELFPESSPAWSPPHETEESTAGDSTLVRRLRVLLHTVPLNALRSGDARRDPELRHYDALALAMKAMDYIAERMGMEREASRESLEKVLEPMLCAMDREAGLEPCEVRHLEMVDRLIAGLRNDSDGRRPFQVDYTDFDGKQAVRRRLEFRLVQEAFGSYGGTVFRLSNEAINIFFHALEADIEDAQAATEAVVQSQLVRGRFEEALRSAQHALRQSRIYRSRLNRVVRDTRRDLSRVDWSVAAPQLIEDAMTHLEARLDAERAIVEVANERLDVLEPGGREASAVSRIGRVMERCIETHTSLQRDLMTVRTTFLDAQARQSFMPAMAQLRPDLGAEVLQPLLGFAVRGAAQVLDQGTPPLLGASAPDALSLFALVEGLLQPRRAPRRTWVPIEPVEPGAALVELQRYAPEVRAAAQRLMESVEEPTRLSRLLARAREEDYAQQVLEVMVLMALQFFDLESSDKPLVQVDRLLGVVLDDLDFHGDEMLISPIAKQPASSDPDGRTGRVPKSFGEQSLQEKEQG